MSYIHNHSPKSYTILEDSVLDCTLSIYEKMVLISIIKFAGKANRAWPGINTIAANGSMSKRQAARTLQDLGSKDLIRIETRSGRTNLYHIPYFIIDDGKLIPHWNPDSTPAPESPHPCPPVRGVMPPGHVGVTDRHGSHDCQSPEQYQRTISKKISQREKPKPPAAKNETNENEKNDFFDSELIQTWSEHFSTQHQPQSADEQTAMDWMLFAAKSNQLCEIKSPIAYLKAITRKGHSQDFIPFQTRKVSAATPIYFQHNAEQKWACINSVYKMGLFLEAKKKGIPEHQYEEFAYQIFEKEYLNEQKQLRS